MQYALTLEDGNRKIHQFKPSIVVLDLNLPDGSGLEMIPVIKNISSAFLVISAYDNKRELVLERGAADFVKKPFDMNTITQSILDINNPGMV